MQAKEIFRMRELPNSFYMSPTADGMGDISSCDHFGVDGHSFTHAHSLAYDRKDCMNGSRHTGEITLSRQLKFYLTKSLGSGRDV